MKPHPKSFACAGFNAARFSRRHLLKVGGLGLLGLNMPGILQAEALLKDRAPKAKVKSVIFLFQFGGPSHIDMFDRKPNAPEGIRGPLKEISSSLPGSPVCENLPRLARLYLNYNLLEDDGAIGFAASPRRSALRELDLRQAGIRDAGGMALAGSDPLDGLDTLLLGGNHFSRQTKSLLRERFGDRLRV